MSSSCVQPLASGLQLIDVVSFASGGGVSQTVAAPLVVHDVLVQRKRRLATLDSSVKKQRKN